MAGGGRPTKCTPELTNAIAADITLGLPGEVAAVAHGVGRSTFYNWLKWGRRREPGFIEFRDAIQKARAEAEHHYVGIIREAAVKSWQAAAWWLERRSPKRWGRWGPSPAPERPTRADRISKMSEEELAAELRRYLGEVEESIEQKRAAHAGEREETN
jgi:hypothetical protein